MTNIYGAGLYSVRLTVENPGEVAEQVRPDYIDVIPEPVMMICLIYLPIALSFRHCIWTSVDEGSGMNGA